jgi:hypothetical protein
MDKSERPLGILNNFICNKAKEWDGKILVPSPVESALSGVKKRSRKMNTCGIKGTLRYLYAGKTSKYS